MPENIRGEGRESRSFRIDRVVQTIALLSAWEMPKKFDGCCKSRYSSVLCVVMGHYALAKCPYGATFIKSLRPTDSLLRQNSARVVIGEWYPREKTSGSKWSWASSCRAKRWGLRDSATRPAFLNTGVAH